jgi:hypothetical protein
MEIPSYWKATCSPVIEIRAGYLDKKQIGWWQDLIINGLGQFFYENEIPFQKPRFQVSRGHSSVKLSEDIPLLNDSKKLKNRVLVPLGGGRDAIVALELLKKRKKEVNAFLVNPTQAAKNVLKVAKIKNPVIVRRQIDPLLLKLNKKGYFNGHTPFTAVLSFLAVFGGVLFGYKNIAFSLERSANEGNVNYLGKMINHQWSKSSEFERKFKWYLKKYLTRDVNYFSPLRLYTELEISKMFLKYPRYFSAFSSCNVVGKGSVPPSPRLRRARWCGNCPKCLFVYATFYPFLEKKKLLKIFGRPHTGTSSVRGKDIFENRKLLPVMKGLLGQGRPKPFECVGTRKESKLAFSLSLKKAKKSGKIPFLLTKIK